MDAVRVAIVGASGYTGAEALRLARAHPNIELTRLCAGARAGQSVARVLPSFVGVDLPKLVSFDAADVAAHADYALLALPHGTAQEAAAALLDVGVRVLDLSADHRFSDPQAYASVYGEHRFPASLAHAVYGLPELNREAIRTARLVGCPGCYPTSVILAAAPAIRAGIVADGVVVADCKSGATGAGRTPSASTHYSEMSDGIRAYKSLAHRHAPEMRQALGCRAVHFVPHLVPMNRGILATVYLQLGENSDVAAIRDVYADAYGEEPFVHLLPPGGHPDTSHVRGSNRCHIALFVADRLLVVQSVIDNLVKGAAGQALQCLNAMADLPETTGLDHTAVFP